MKPGRAFALVGAMGFAAQMGILALLRRCFPSHPIGISLAALECTLLHNFAWHRRLTWRDRDGGLTALWRFHAANGAVSLAGTLALVWILNVGMHLPLLLANVVAVGCSAVVNFMAAERWVFTERRGGQKPGPVPR